MRRVEPDDLGPGDQVGSEHHGGAPGLVGDKAVQRQVP